MTKDNWKNEIYCPYCKKDFVEVRQLSTKPELYWWNCKNCKQSESWLTEYNLYTTYEEERKNE